MNDENRLIDGSIIIALLDKPSSKSFGMCPLIVRNSEYDFYQITGLASGIKRLEQKEYEQLEGHYLKVQLPLPLHQSNPVASWLGSRFYARAEELKAPPLPLMDECWHQPLEPYTEEGKYCIKEPAEAYKTLDDWVTKAGFQALTSNNDKISYLMHWTLPTSPKTKAALYFTQPTEERKRRELESQLKLLNDAGRNITKEELILEHERTKQILLSQRL